MNRKGSGHVAATKNDCKPQGDYVTQLPSERRLPTSVIGDVGVGLCSRVCCKEVQHALEGPRFQRSMSGNGETSPTLFFQQSCIDLGTCEMKNRLCVHT